MAIFLLGGLLVSGSVMGSDKQGVLGGPDPAATSAPSVVDTSGTLYSQNMRMDNGPQLSFPESPILSATLVASPAQSDNSAPPQDSDAEAQLAAKSLPSLPKGYLSMPVAGLNWGKLHDNNAVDIANACGTPVYSAAEGVVIPDTSIQDDGTGWNGGYGNFVLIEHPNGVKTRYAHLEEILVKIGDYVPKRQKIGLMGSTGRATGCHLHFEVLGAKNPFAK